MQIFAAATRNVIHQHGFEAALPIIATMHNCTIAVAREIARSVQGRQDDTISPLSDAINNEDGPSYYRHRGARRSPQNF